MENTSWILYRLYSLDTSSRDFLDNLHALILDDDEERHLTDPQEPVLTWSLNSLDKARTIPSTFRRFQDGPL